MYDQLTVSLASAEAKVAALKARVSEYEVRYKELQTAANAMPEVEAEYKQLTRDYEVIRNRYDKLLERREQAQISGAVEASDVVLGFRVIDPPRVPLAPIAPKRPLLMTIVLLAALGGGFGIAFVMSQLKTTFNTERELHQATGIRVLGSIATALTPRLRRRRTRASMAFVLSYLGLLSTYGALMAMLVISAGRV